MDNAKLREIRDLLVDEREAFVASRFPLMQATLEEFCGATGLPAGALDGILESMANKGLARSARGSRPMRTRAGSSPTALVGQWPIATAGTSRRIWGRPAARAPRWRLSALVLGEAARVLVRRGFAEERSVAQMLVTLDYARSLGLTHVTDNVHERPSCLCNCCRCCCELMTGVRSSFPDGLAKTAFIAQVEDPPRCEYCAECLPACDVKCVGLASGARGPAGRGPDKSDAIDGTDNVARDGQDSIGSSRVRLEEICSFFRDDAAQEIGSSPKQCAP